MKKWLVGIIAIVVIIVNTSCTKEEVIETRTFDQDILEVYSNELKELFGDYQLIKKNQIITDTVYSYSKGFIYDYDEWELEYQNVSDRNIMVSLNNRFEFIGQIKHIIIDTIAKELSDNISGKFVDPVINFENSIDDMDEFKEIPIEYYPKNLNLQNVSKDMLIVVSLSEKDIEEYPKNKEKFINELLLLNLENVLLLYENAAYAMSHGVFIHDKSVINESISAEDTFKWIQDNQ